MKSVKEIMTNSPKSCEKHEPLQKVVTEMVKADVSFLPIVDKEKKVIGIITDRDISATMNKTYKSLAEIKVREVMAEQVHTCLVNDDISDVLRMMKTKKVSRLPVVDKDGHLKGIITLNAIMLQLYGNNREAETVFAGKENMANALHSITERNNHLSFEHDSFEE